MSDLQAQSVMMPTHKISRARLFAGNTYFRAKEVGEAGNRISIEISGGYTINVTKEESQTSFVFSGSGEPAMSAIIFPTQSSEIFFVTTSDAKTFSVTGSVTGNMGTVDSGKIFRHSKLVFSIAKKNHAPGDTYTIHAGQKETFTASNIYAMRTLVNSSSSLIEMPSRGEDIQDRTGDDPLNGQFEVISKTYLSGGDGLPKYPSGTSLGFPIPMVYVDSIEDKYGVDQPVAKVYQWTDTLESGHWVQFGPNVYIAPVAYEPLPPPPNVPPTPVPLPDPTDPTSTIDPSWIVSQEYRLLQPAEAAMNGFPGIPAPNPNLINGRVLLRMGYVSAMAVDGYGVEAQYMSGTFYGWGYAAQSRTVYKDPTTEETMYTSDWYAGRVGTVSQDHSNFVPPPPGFDPALGAGQGPF